MGNEATPVMDLTIGANRNPLPEQQHILEQTNKKPSGSFRTEAFPVP